MKIIIKGYLFEKVKNILIKDGANFSDVYKIATNVATHFSDRDVVRPSIRVKKHKVVIKFSYSFEAGFCVDDFIKNGWKLVK